MQIYRPSFISHPSSALCIMRPGVRQCCRADFLPLARRVRMHFAGLVPVVETIDQLNGPAQSRVVLDGLYARRDTIFLASLGR
jgi:hypothetical protein